MRQDPLNLASRNRGIAVGTADRLVLDILSNAVLDVWVRGMSRALLRRRVVSAILEIGSGGIVDDLARGGGVDGYANSLVLLGRHVEGRYYRIID